MGIPKKEKRIYKDEEATRVGLMVGIPETLYMWTVSFRSNAYMEFYDDEWVAWRETYARDRNGAISYKLIARGNTFSYVLQEFRKYIDFVSMKRR